MPDPIPRAPGAVLATPPAVAWADGSDIGGYAPVTPPISDQAWVDVQTTYEHVLLSLRITTADIDAEQVLACVSAAGSLIDQYLDRITPLPVPPPPPVQQALEQLSIELYRRKDAPFNLLNATVPEDIPVDIGATGAIQSVAPLIQPWKQRWGMA